MENQKHAHIVFVVVGLLCLLAIAWGLFGGRPEDKSSLAAVAAGVSGLVAIGVLFLTRRWETKGTIPPPASGIREITIQSSNMNPVVIPTVMIDSNTSHDGTRQLRFVESTSHAGVRATSRCVLRLTKSGQTVPKVKAPYFIPANALAGLSYGNSPNYSDYMGGPNNAWSLTFTVPAWTGEVFVTGDMLEVEVLLIAEVSVTGLAGVRATKQIFIRSVYHF